jgi:hypothetical protein
MNPGYLSGIRTMTRQISSQKSDAAIFGGAAALCLDGAGRGQDGDPRQVRVHHQLGQSQGSILQNSVRPKKYWINFHPLILAQLPTTSKLLLIFIVYWTTIFDYII